MTLVLGIFLRALQGGLACGLTPAFSEMFPTHVRTSGAGFCASFGCGFSSLMPALVGIVSSQIHLGYAMGNLAIASYIVGILAALCLPNSTGINPRTFINFSAVNQRLVGGVFKLVMLRRWGDIISMHH